MDKLQQQKSGVANQAPQRTLYTTCHAEYPTSHMDIEHHNFSPGNVFYGKPMYARSQDVQTPTSCQKHQSVNHNPIYRNSQSSALLQNKQHYIPRNNEDRLRTPYLKMRVKAQDSRKYCRRDQTGELNYQSGSNTREPTKGIYETKTWNEQPFQYVSNLPCSSNTKENMYQNEQTPVCQWKDTNNSPRQWNEVNSNDWVPRFRNYGSSPKPTGRYNHNLKIDLQSTSPVDQHNFLATPGFHQSSNNNNSISTNITQPLDVYDQPLGMYAQPQIQATYSRQISNKEQFQTKYVENSEFYVRQNNYSTEVYKNRLENTTKPKLTMDISQESTKEVSVSFQGAAPFQLTRKATNLVQSTTNYTTSQGRIFSQNAVNQKQVGCHTVSTGGQKTIISPRSTSQNTATSSNCARSSILTANEITYDAHDSRPLPRDVQPEIAQDKRALDLRMHNNPGVTNNGINADMTGKKLTDFTECQQTFSPWDKRLCDFVISSENDTRERLTGVQSDPDCLPLITSCYSLNPEVIMIQESTEKLKLMENLINRSNKNIPNLDSMTKLKSPPRNSNKRQRHSQTINEQYSKLNAMSEKLYHVNERGSWGESVQSLEPNMHVAEINLSLKPETRDSKTQTSIPEIQYRSSPKLTTRDSETQTSKLDIDMEIPSPSHYSKTYHEASCQTTATVTANVENTIAGKNGDNVECCLGLVDPQCTFGSNSPFEQTVQPEVVVPFALHTSPMLPVLAAMSLSKKYPDLVKSTTTSAQVHETICDNVDTNNEVHCDKVRQCHESPFTPQNMQNLTKNMEIDLELKNTNSNPPKFPSFVPAEANCMNTPNVPVRLKSMSDLFSDVSDDEEESMTKLVPGENESHYRNASFVSSELKSFRVSEDGASIPVVKGLDTKIKEKSNQSEIKISREFERKISCESEKSFVSTGSNESLISILSFRDDFSETEDAVAKDFDKPVEQCIPHYTNEEFESNDLIPSYSAKENKRESSEDGICNVLDSSINDCADTKIFTTTKNSKLEATIDKLKNSLSDYSILDGNALDNLIEETNNNFDEYFEPLEFEQGLRSFDCINYGFAISKKRRLPSETLSSSDSNESSDDSEIFIKTKQKKLIDNRHFHHQHITHKTRFKHGTTRMGNWSSKEFPLVPYLPHKPIPGLKNKKYSFGEKQRDINLAIQSLAILGMFSVDKTQLLKKGI